jgi:hypothetical protein
VPGAIVLPIALPPVDVLAVTARHHKRTTHTLSHTHSLHTHRAAANYILPMVWLSSVVACSSVSPSVASS